MDRKLKERQIKEGEMRNLDINAIPSPGLLTVYLTSALSAA
jgi:hypothetical protein